MAPEQPARSGIDFSAFRDPKLARELIERIHELVGDRTINLMDCLLYTSDAADD